VGPPPGDPTLPLPAAPPPGAPGVPPPLVEGAPEPPPPERELWPWLLLLALVVVGGLVVAWAATRGGDHKKTSTVTVTTAARVPDVLGLARSTAVARLQDAGLQAAVTSKASTHPVDTVIAESPPPGSSVPQRSVVHLIVAAKPPAVAVAVPDIVGQRAGDATKALVAAGLRVQTAAAFSGEPVGTVISAAPAPGTKVAKGSVVTITVSKGAPPATTTEVTTTAPTATATTATATTTVATTATTVATTTAPPPPETATVPDVVGQTQNEARHTLKDAGLVAAVAYVHANLPFDQVVAQFPKPGATAKKDARVRINVSLGPNPKPQVAVPDVTSDNETTAASTLRAAGFKVESADRATTDPSADGVVLDQDPVAGTQAPQGSTVTIFVGRSSSG
jgi:serine/threonine-protein kinase